MNHYWWLVVPDLIDDEQCELCDDIAMPFDEKTEYPWCPQHAMQMWCGLGTEDYEINADTERYWETRKISDQIPIQDTLCINSLYEDFCWNEATPRLKKNRMDAPDITRACANLCTEHAHKHFGVDGFLTMEDWLMECEPGYKASLSMEDEEY